MVPFDIADIFAAAIHATLFDYVDDMPPRHTPCRFFAAAARYVIILIISLLPLPMFSMLRRCYTGRLICDAASY